MGDRRNKMRRWKEEEMREEGEYRKYEANEGSGGGGGRFPVFGK